MRSKQGALDMSSDMSFSSVVYSLPSTSPYVNTVVRDGTPYVRQWTSTTQGLQFIGTAGNQPEYVPSWYNGRSGVRMRGAVGQSLTLRSTSSAPFQITGNVMWSMVIQLEHGETTLPAILSMNDWTLAFSATDGLGRLSGTNLIATQAVLIPLNRPFLLSVWVTLNEVRLFANGQFIGLFTKMRHSKAIQDITIGGGTTPFFTDLIVGDLTLFQNVSQREMTTIHAQLCATYKLVHEFNVPRAVQMPDSLITYYDARLNTTMNYADFTGGSIEQVLSNNQQVYRWYNRASSCYKQCPYAEQVNFVNRPLWTNTGVLLIGGLPSLSFVYIQSLVEASSVNGDKTFAPNDTLLLVAQIPQYTSGIQPILSMGNLNIYVESMSSGMLRLGMTGVTTGGVGYVGLNVPFVIGITLSSVRSFSVLCGQGVYGSGVTSISGSPMGQNQFTFSTPLSSVMRFNSSSTGALGTTSIGLFKRWSFPMTIDELTQTVRQTANEWNI